MKQVSAVIDSRTTPVCLHAAGQIRPVEEPFDTLLGEQMEPPFHVHCRSIVGIWMPGFVNDQRRDANAELKTRPLKQRRIGPGGETGPLPPKAGPRTPPPSTPPAPAPLATIPVRSGRAVKVLDEAARTTHMKDSVTFPWQMSDDIEQRATELWAPTFDGQRTIRAILQNRLAGKDDWDGIVIPDRLAGRHLLTDWDGVVWYDLDDLRADLVSAANVIAKGLNDSADSVQVLWRGMRVDDPENLFAVGTPVPVEMASFSDVKKAANQYADLIDETYGRKADNEPVMIRLILSGGYRLKLHSPEIGWTGEQGEVLVRKNLIVVGHDRDESGRLIVDVEAV